MKVAVIGLGKAGLPLAAVMAAAGILVTGVDVDSKRVQQINLGRNPIPEEPELGDLLKLHGGKRLLATAVYEDAADCDAFIVIVPLFIDDSHKPDFSILEKAFTSVAKVMKPGSLVVLETTVPPGTTNSLVTRLGEKEHLLAYSPERIMTGYSVSRYREFPKVVGGVTKEAGEKAFKLYSKFCKTVHEATDAKTAELIKVAEGVYRDVNIALANELLKVSDRLGVDLFEVRKFANHEFCHIHRPGSVGGHCIPVYPWFLMHDYEVPLIKQARLENDEIVHYYAKALAKKIGATGKVLVVGITFREGVKELAYTPGIPMIKLLEGMGYEVYVHDPMYCDEEILELGFKPSKAYEEMDGIMLLNDYKNLKNELAPFKQKTIDVKGLFSDFAD